MKIIDTTIADVKIIEPQVFGDSRGYFMETWNQASFLEQGLDINFVQDNHSRSTQGILRGLHYQLQQTQGKLVRVVTGAVFDVAVDIRQHSPTFGQWVGVELNDTNHRMLWVPPGFAHGFYVMSQQADFLYKCTDLYAPEHEQCILWDDPAIGIQWPIVNQPLLSDKDKQGLLLKDAKVFDTL
ncbi:MAG: dTDP-4-dehydrorhamnose 3,5-epimerase [Thiotrichaceae bacterium]|nr:dTDP-4-dehydrorhamnose 3,5-epimerase [Thiotrichaceae bacterium]